MSTTLKDPPVSASIPTNHRPVDFYNPAAKFASQILWPMTIAFGPGAVGGVCNVLVGHPVDLVKVRLQTSTSTSKNSSTFSMLRQILKTNGLNGLYVGVSAPLVAVVPAFAITFGSFEYTKSYFHSINKTDHSNKNEQLSLKQIGIAGGVSGLFLASVLGPLERIKCLMQVSNNNPQYSTFQGTLQEVYRNGGIRSVFRGTALTVARDVPGNAVYFITYEAIKRTLTEYTTSLSTMSITLLSGGMAGVGNWIIAIPLDVIKSRWQTNDTSYTNIRHCITSLIQKEGYKALFKGLSPALIRAFPANAACLLGVETTKNCLQYWK